MCVLVIFSQMYTQHSCKQKISEVIQQWGKNRGRNTKIGSWEDAKITNQDANISPLVDDTLRQREGRRISAPRFVGGSVDWFSLYRRETWPPLLLICLPCYSLTSQISLDQIRSVSQSCPTLCDPMNCSTPGLPVHHQLPGYLFLKIYKRHIFKSGGTSRDLPLAVTPEGPVGGLRLLCPFRLARAFCTGPWASPCPRAWRPTRWRCCCWSCCTRQTTATTSTGR